VAEKKRDQVSRLPTKEVPPNTDQEAARKNRREIRAIPKKAEMKIGECDP